MAGDIEENVEITVTGADQLEAAAEAARELDDRLKAARDALAEMDAAGEGVEAAAAAMAEAAEAAEAYARAADNARDAVLGADAANVSLAGTSQAAAAGLTEEAEAAASLAAAAEAAGLSVDQFRNRAIMLDAVARDASARLDDFDKDMLDTAAAGEAAGEGIDAIRDAVAEADAAFAAGIAAADEYRNKLFETAMAAGTADHSIEKLGRRALETAAEQAAANAASSGSGFFSIGGGGGSILAAANPGNMGALAAGAAVGATVIPALVVELSALTGGLLSAGAGAGAFAALAIPAFEKTKTAYTNLTTAEQAYRSAQLLEQHDPTKDNRVAERTALAQLEIARQAFAKLSPEEQGAVRGIQQLNAEYKSMSKAFEPDAFKVFNSGLKLASNLLPHLTPFADTAAKSIDGLLKDADKFSESKGFQDWLGQLQKLEGPSITAIGDGIGDIAVNLGKFATALPPKDVVNGINIAFRSISDTIAALSFITDRARKNWDGFTDAFRHTKDAAGDLVGAGAAVARFLHLFGAHDKPVITPTVDTSKLRASIEGTHGDLLSAPVKIPVSFSVRKFDAQTLMQGVSQEPIRISVVPEFHKGAFDATTLKEGMSGAGNPKVPVGVAPQVDKNGMQKSMDDAAKQVKVHGITVDLSNAKLSGLSALAGTMQKAGKQAGDDLDRAVASAIASGASRAAADARDITSQVKAALAPLGPAGHSIGAALGEGLAAGIESETGAAVAAASAMAAAVESAARVQLQTQSPSKVFDKIGRETVAGFVQGLNGGRSQIRAAEDAIFGHAYRDSAVESSIAKLRDEVAAALRAGVIDAGQDTAYTALIREDNKRLESLARERSALESRIKAADALASSVRAAAIDAGSVTSAFGMTFAGQNATAGQATYRTVNQALKAQLGETEKFRADIAKLKKEGLDERSIQQLLAAGVSGGLPEATELLASGKKGIGETSRLEAEITKASSQLGITGANASYEAASQIGKGLAKGLRSELRGVEDEMRHVADVLVEAIRRALRISSPSQVMADIGSMVPAGLAQGIDAHRSLVSAAGQRMALAAVVSPVARPGAYAHAGGDGNYGGPSVLNLTVINEMNGKQVSRELQTIQLQHAHRNTATGLKIRGRGI